MFRGPRYRVLPPVARFILSLRRDEGILDMIIPIGDLEAVGPGLLRIEEFHLDAALRQI